MQAVVDRETSSTIHYLKDLNSNFEKGWYLIRLTTFDPKASVDGIMMFEEETPELMRINFEPRGDKTFQSLVYLANAPKALDLSSSETRLSEVKKLIVKRCGLGG